MALQFNPYPTGPWEQAQARDARPDINQNLTQPLLQGLEMLGQNQERERMAKRDEALLALQQAQANRQAQMQDRQNEFEYGTKLPPMNPMTPGSTTLEGMPAGMAGKSAFMPGGEGKVGTGGLVGQFRQWQDRRKGAVDLSAYGVSPEQANSLGMGDLSEYSDIGQRRRDQLLKLAELPRKRAEADANIDLMNARRDALEKNGGATPETYTNAGVDAEGNIIMVGSKSTTVKKVPIPGGGAIYGKTPSESQTNAGLFGKRAEEANAQLAELISSGVDPSSLVLGAESKLPNMFQGKSAQQLAQIKRNFVSAVLRKESGAAISVPEMQEAEKQYFPQAGDSPEVQKQKEQNRMTAISGLNRAAGPMAMNRPTGTTKPRTVVQNGHTYTLNESTGQYE